MICIKKYLAWVSALNKGCYSLIGILLIAMAISTLFQVLVRFVFTYVGFNFSAPWTEELSRYCMIWVVFIGMGVGCRHAQLIALTFIVDKLPGIAGKVVKYASFLLCIFFFSLLVKVGMQFVEFGSIERSPAMSVSKSWVYLAMPAGSLLAIINTLALIFDSYLDSPSTRKSLGTDETLHDRKVTP